MPVGSQAMDLARFSDLVYHEYFVLIQKESSGNKELLLQQVEQRRSAYFTPGKALCSGVQCTS